MKPERSIRAIGIGALLVLSTIILFYPVQEAWIDSGNGELTLSFLLIAIIPFVAAIGVIGAIGYILVNDVATTHVLSAARWAWGAVIFSWLMHEYVIILQQIGGVVDYRLNMVTTVATWAMLGLAIGSNRSYRSEQQRVLEAERDRFSSLFENTTDAIIEATVDTDGNFLIDQTNQTFDQTFDRHPEGLLRDVGSSEDGHYDFGALRERITSGDAYSAELRYENGSETRYFRLGTVESGENRSFISLTEITSQRKREQLLEERGERLEREKTAREEDLEERTNQLEFLHSLLRHNVQNGVMVIQSRAQHIANNVNDQLKEYAETIVSRSDEISDQTDRMRTMIDTLASDELSTEPVALADVLSHRVATVGPMYPEADVSIDGTVPDVDVEADEMLDNVFDNLLQNGVLHNDSEQPRVTVRATDQDDSVRIEIADNGPGIPEERRDDVFRRGVSSGTESGDSGSGFGLFFVDTMVDAYGGDIRIADRDPSGTRFIMTLNKPGSNSEQEKPATENSSHVE